jgi:hypothetical protein
LGNLIDSLPEQLVGVRVPDIIIDPLIYDLFQFVYKSLCRLLIKARFASQMTDRSGGIDLDKQGVVIAIYGY